MMLPHARNLDEAADEYSCAMLEKSRLRTVGEALILQQEAKVVRLEQGDLSARL